MKSLTCSLFILLFYTSVIAQKYVSMVEVFCNTGDSQALSVFPELTEHAAIADTSDLNELFIQYHVAGDYPDWTDEFASNTAAEQWSLYEGLELVDGGCVVVKNGEPSGATDWFDCTPEETYIYGLAKKVTVLFESFDADENSVDIEVALYTEYDESDSVFVHVLALEKERLVEVTGGENAGSILELNNVVRAGEVFSAIDYSSNVTLSLPEDAVVENVIIVAFVQDHTSGAVLGGTRGIELESYINAPGDHFAVVENFVNSGCFGGPPAINSMTNYVEISESNDENQVLVQLHIGQTYGNWNDVYKMPLNDQRYDKYAWDMGIIAGLAAVAKNGIRYKEHTWNNCSPLDKVATDFVEIEFQSMEDNQLVVEYALSGNLGVHDRVYFYVVERELDVFVTGAEIPGTQLYMNNVARVGRRKHVQTVADTVLLHIPSDVQFENARVLAYIQNDVTYEITGGTKGFPLSVYTGIRENDDGIFTIYPNPLVGKSDLNLKFRDAGQSSTIRIHNVNGQLLHEREFNYTPAIISIGGLNLSPGLYQIEITLGEKYYTEKLIVR